MSEKNNDKNVSSKQENLPVKRIGKFQCISKCYKKGTRVRHPYGSVNELITSATDDFCAIVPFHDANNKLNFITPCISTEKDENVKTLDNGLYPLMRFDPKFFLEIYYKIYDVSDLYEWLNNNNVLFTKIRIIDCFLRSSGKDILIVEAPLTNAVVEIIKK